MKRKKSKKRKTITGRLQLRSLFCQPPPGFYHLPDIEIRNGCVVTDGCRRVLEFTPERLCLDMGGPVLVFYGKGLQIESLQGRRLQVVGQINGIELDREAGGGR